MYTDTLFKWCQSRQSSPNQSRPFFTLCFASLRWSSLLHRTLLICDIISHPWREHRCFYRLALCLCRLDLRVFSGVFGFIFWISPNPADSEKVYSCLRCPQTEHALLILLLTFMLLLKQQTFCPRVEASLCSTHQYFLGAGALLPVDCWWPVLKLFWAQVFLDSLSFSVPRRLIIVYVRTCHTAIANWVISRR